MATPPNKTAALNSASNTPSDRTVASPVLREIAPAAAELEQLRKRHTDLDRRKAVAQANLKNAVEQIDLLKSQARQLYGTDDLEELRRILDAMRQSNRQKVAQYQKHLEEIEGKLAEVEKEYQQGRG